ncbi:MAG TPA: Fe2+-dependent dioxygenase [Chitinophagaceae bacterium]|nr:Fe2+-dependent dioxygenase [Chitinophagaceae bacterium]
MQLPQMLLHVPGLLSVDQLKEVDTLLADLQFVDGRATATGAAREVKHNLQVSKDAHVAHPQLQQLVARAIMSNQLVQQGIMPVKILPPIISKYEPGMHYGWHTDSPLMGDEFTIRVDVSITVFLNDPKSYEGGELVIHGPAGYVQYKLERGDAIIYPTTRLHGVNQVVSGHRLAAVTWMQCAVKSPEQRELLFQMKAATDMIGNSKPNSGEHLMLMQVYSNLVRMWAEL